MDFTIVAWQKALKLWNYSRHIEQKFLHNIIKVPVFLSVPINVMCYYKTNNKKNVYVFLNVRWKPDFQTLLHSQQIFSVLSSHSINLLFTISGVYSFPNLFYFHPFSRYKYIFKFKVKVTSTYTYISHTIIWITAKMLQFKSK